MTKQKHNADGLTPRALARALGVSVATIARWRKQGCPFKETSTFFIGAQASRPRYNLEAVKVWIQQKKAEHITQ